MDSLSFTCYKIASQLPLGRISSFFELEWGLKRLDYMVLEDRQLEMILHRNISASQRAYLFEYGCITLVDFDEGDVWAFLNFLSSIVSHIDTAMAFKYYEHHTIEIVEGNCRLWDGYEGVVPFESVVVDVVAIILAKSSALTKVEKDTSALLDEAEELIIRLQRGRLYAHTRKFAITTSRMLRFEYDSMSSIRIFDTAGASSNTVNSRKAYDDFAGFFELHQRFDDLQNKIQELRRITEMYSQLSYQNVETRLYVFEIILLALFPLSHLIHYLLGK